MKVFLAALLFSICHLALAQDSYPMDAFRPPLDIPLVLAGNFGELRSNHFHSGIDIKTQQREGLSVHAIADGTITRIKVSLWGYGKVIYIAHPNGYTSVYGHLQKFSPAIEAFIKKIQYEKQQYEVEVFPDYGELPVVQGEVIAYSGNTGSSAGPHLHFEIRNSISERPINPLLFGLEVRDATSPTLQDVFAYPLSDNAQLNQGNGELQIKYSRQPDGTYLADPLHAAGTIGFGLTAYDRQDLAANKNGVYRVRQLVNGSVFTDYSFDSFSFSESRYINTLIDYAHYARSYDRIQRMYRIPGNKLDIYKTLQNDGKLVIQEGLTYNVDLELSDIEGNTTLVRIPVEGKRDSLQEIVEKEKTPNFLLASKPNNYDLGIAKVYFPAGTFYENLYLRLQKGADTVMIHDNTVPAHHNFTITFDVTRYAPEKRRQLFIAHLDDRLRPEYETTYKRGNTFTTRTRDLGTYTLATDSIAPKIWAKNFKEGQWLTNFHYLKLHISDDLSGIDSYSAFLNGNWILMEYEPKSNTLTYNFDDRIAGETQCQLDVTVTDNVGNKSTFKSTFYRK